MGSSKINNKISTMKIEEFIKHLESKEYELFGNTNHYCSLGKKDNFGQKRGIKYYYPSQFLEIHAYYETLDSFLFDGKIESLEQFDLIDRLTS